MLIRPQVAADAVVDVHHRVADLQLRQVLDQRVDVAGLLLAAPPARRRRGREQLGLGDELRSSPRRSRLVPDEALRPAAPPRSRSARRRPRTRPASPTLGGSMRLSRSSSSRLSRRPSLSATSSTRCGVARDVVAAARASGSGAPRSTLRSGSGAGPGIGASSRCRAAPACACALRQREELLGSQEQLLGRQERPLGVVLQEAVALARVGPEALQRRVDLAVQHQRRRRRRGSRRSSRSRRRTAAGSTRCRRWRCRRRCPCRCATLVGSPSSCSRQRARNAVRAASSIGNSRPGQQPHLGHRVEAALRVGVEGADRIDLVAEQVDAVGHGRAHREQVDQAAAHRVLAGRHDLADVAVAGERELRLQRGLVEPLLLLEVEGVAGQEARRREAHQRGRGRHQHDVDVAAAGCATASPAARRSGPGAARRCRRAASPSRGTRRTRSSGAKNGELVGQALRVGRARR